LKQAAKVTIVGDTVIIAAMETAEISLALLIPRFMHAALTDTLNSESSLWILIS
jgi:hypothetical protein